ATAIAGSTWPAVPPPASTTDNEECPVGPVADDPVTESLTRSADLPVLDGHVRDAGRWTAVRLHDALPRCHACPPRAVWPDALPGHRTASAWRRAAAWPASAFCATGRAAPRPGSASKAPATAAAECGSSGRRVRRAALRRPRVRAWPRWPSCRSSKVLWP